MFIFKKFKEKNEIPLHYTPVLLTLIKLHIKMQIWARANIIIVGIIII